MRKCIVAGVLIMSMDGRKVLLVKHRKLGVWIYPGGHIEENETPLECAVRESEEETGASFDVLNTDEFTVRAEAANSLPRPLVIMDEIVPYSTGAHEHFDMIYLGIARGMEFHPNNESTDCRWFEKEDIESIETFENVKEIIKYGFSTLANIKKK
ncbi:MAG: NUDIX domain-containing protein [Candidatus Thermoplasmatota archaeon]|nr:NUDIX domain-containing protein [Candidatus Thermoplasmatota archaeon]